MKSKTLFSLLTVCFTLAQAAPERTRIFHEAVHTLKVENMADFFAPPVLSLPDNRVRLAFSFDMLEPEVRYLRYSLAHLDPLGNPSQILPTEYVSGFNEGRVEDYGFSSATFRQYVNYRITLPSEDMQPLLSGNYLLNVCDEDDPDTPLLTARFAVSEDIGTISADYSHLTDRGNDGPWQQLSFSYNPGEFELRDPFSDLRAFVVQNGDPASAVEVKPLRMQGAAIVYEHKPELLFLAGNEYRRFETTRTDYTGMHIAANRYEDDGYTATLMTDESRADAPYVYDRTQYGRFKVDEYNSTDPDLGADYVLTEFTLDFPRVMDGDVYIDGEFTRSLPPEASRLTYSEDDHLYHHSMLLKQGSYNYRYVLRATPDSPSVASPVEGDFPETQNEFTIYIYYQPPGARYARLLNVATVK